MKQGLWNGGLCGCFLVAETAADAEGSWVAESSSSVVVAPSGAALVGSGESCAGEWGAGGAAGPAGAHALGREEVLLAGKGGAAGTAVVADETDEEEAFGRIAANWREMGRENQNSLSEHISLWEDSDIIACSHVLTNMSIHKQSWAWKLLRWQKRWKK